MAVRIEKNFKVQQPVEKAWVLLKDPRVVANFVPGAKITEAVDERTFKGAISVKVGPTLTDFKGELVMELVDEEHHQIQLAGKGQDVRGKASASMKMNCALNPTDDGTEVKTVADINVVGILAQFGGRMIQDVSDVMFKEFVKRFQLRLEQPEEAAAAEAEPNDPVNALKVASTLLGRSVRRVFSGSDENGENS